MLQKKERATFLHSKMNMLSYDHQPVHIFLHEQHELAVTGMQSGEAAAA